ncbi:MAG: hypothetical protein F4019_11595 [Rhodothermaceae bacterium]|nr:hypothetical protein [Rhodothermaceae bacterium]MYG44104.1 hypothetical protein [Rhodothermaceae bacterium]MYK64806.1 hypothetical protein [Rhodothermaceae bacterium]
MSWLWGPWNRKNASLMRIGPRTGPSRPRIRFYRCRALVEQLMQAKHDQCLSPFMKQLLRFEALIVDGIGYGTLSPEEADVLFQLLAERYEHGSILISCHLAFSEWKQIFQNPITTTAVVDRLVHHSVILELDLPSYRLEVARQRQNEEQDPSKTNDT